MNFSSYLENLSFLEMWQVWIDRKNVRGFDYEQGVGDKKIIKHDFMFFKK